MRKIYTILFLVVFLFSITSAQTNDALDYLKHGNLFSRSNQFEQALIEYKKGLAVPGKYEAVFHYNIGVCYYQLGQTQDAVQEFQIALKQRNGDYQKAWYSLGMAYSDLKDWSNAKNAFKEAIEKSGGKDAEAMFDLAVVLAQEGDYKNAIEYFQNAITYSSISSIESRNNLGVMYAKTGDLIKAKREFELALKESDGKLKAAFANLKFCKQLIVSTSETSAAVWKLAATNKSLNTLGE